MRCLILTLVGASAMLVWGPGVQTAQAGTVTINGKVNVKLSKNVVLQWQNTAETQKSYQATCVVTAYINGKSVAKQNVTLVPKGTNIASFFMTMMTSRGFTGSYKVQCDSSKLKTGDNLEVTAIVCLQAGAQTVCNRGSSLAKMHWWNWLAPFWSYPADIDVQF